MSGYSLSFNVGELGGCDDDGPTEDYGARSLACSPENASARGLTKLTAGKLHAKTTKRTQQHSAPIASSELVCVVVCE